MNKTIISREAAERLVKALDEALESESLTSKVYRKSASLEAANYHLRIETGYYGDDVSLDLIPEGETNRVYTVILDSLGTDEIHNLSEGSKDDVHILDIVIASILMG